MRSSFRPSSSAGASIPFAGTWLKVAAGAFFTEQAYLCGVAESTLARTHAKRQSVQGRRHGRAQHRHDHEEDKRMTPALWTAARGGVAWRAGSGPRAGALPGGQAVRGPKVLRFSLGFGPKLFSFTAGSTEYRLSLFPLGGYVRLVGEKRASLWPTKDRERAMCSKPLWQRFCHRDGRAHCFN